MFGISFETGLNMASLYIKDGETAALVDQLARQRGTTKTEAVRTAVKAALAHDEHGGAKTRLPARDYLADFDRRFPPLRPSGRKADKAFFDDLSGNL